jgi:plastocyanin
MRFTLTSAALAATLATVASAATFQVQVGQNSTLTFNPPFINATAGDTIQFMFNPKNHTVTQSTFAAPCQAMANGLDSGYKPVTANSTQTPVVIVTVNSTDPVWFFCRQSNHCASGMVFAVNPTANKTFEAYQAAAKASNSTGSTTGSTTGSASSAASTPSSSASTPSSGKNGAITVGAQAGSLLAVVGFVAGLLL